MLGKSPTSNVWAETFRGDLDQSNNFFLKWSFFIVNQNDIYQKFQKFTWKPQLAYFVCSFACMTSLTYRYNLIFQNFATSLVRKNGQKHHKTLLYTPTWKQINIYQKYASPVLAFSQSTICLLTDKKQKNENFLLGRFFLMWAWSYTVKIGFLKRFKTKIIKYKMQKVVK